MWSREDEDKLVRLLALVWRSVDWRKIRTRHPHADIFNHRVRAATSSATLKEFISKLANFFGVQSVSPGALEIVDEFAGRDEEVLNVLYREHIYYATRAGLEARALYRVSKRKKSSDEDQDDDGGAS